MDLEIKEVTDRGQLKAFVKFPFSLYKNHPYWVPPIIKTEMDTLSPATNPAFEHSVAKLFTAWQNGKMVGRIAGIVNDLETKHLGSKHARFGWIDFIDDKKVSAALMAALEQWAKKEGAVLLKGPYGFNQLDKNGMLTEGFDSLGTFGTLYNYPYYPKHLEAHGYEKDLEWVEVDLQLENEPPERFQRFADIAQKRYGMKIFQPKGKNQMRKIVKHLFDLMMETYSELPGFIPISEKHRDAYMKQYVTFLRKEFLCVITDESGEPIGFSVCFPSLSKAMQRANGKLFPFGIFHLNAASYFNDTGDLALIGVKEEWRKKGVHSIIFNETTKAFIKAGMMRVQINPMLEFNTNVLSLWKDFEHKIYKRRRTYKKALLA